ncbi:TRAP transporter substrate-binding protein [Microvirga pudoricolor]|uniref:TRAP transporter substrate-binding protein n=1 Tax=Microvirga pudoricolor TaxID=2778729 RepID=UPI00195120CE|nr:TRAP transporter substrate-binding protein [Microvirga pudoricolor]MBM6596640.1 TRAP transporter substrate-binding protein [Microvirga pudoricolor]
MKVTSLSRRALGLLTGVALLTAAVGAQAQDRTLKFAFSLAKDHPIGIGAQKFADLVAAKSGGKLKVNLFPNAVLGSDPQNLSAVRGGTLDFTIMATGLLAGLNKEFMVFDFPFLFRDFKEAYALSDGPIAKSLLAKLDSQGVVGLGIWDLGFRNITNSKRPIAKPEDLVGLKLRVIASPIYIETFKALGANPVPMTFGEVYGALESRAIDGQDNPVAVIESAKFAEVQKYLSLTRHLYTGMPLMMSKKTWDALSAEERSVIQAAADEAKVEERQALQSQEAGAIDRLRKVMQVNEVAPDELERMKEKVRPVVEKFSSEVGEALSKQVSDELARLRAN